MPSMSQDQSKTMKEELTLRDGSKVLYESNLPKGDSALEKEMHKLRRKSFKVVENDKRL